MGKLSLGKLGVPAGLGAGALLAGFDFRFALDWVIRIAIGALSRLGEPAILFQSNINMNVGRAYRRAKSIFSRKRRISQLA
jgi:hypothetical protein